MTTGDSVVVGVDGSDAAIETAQWAVREAVARDLPLKLIFAADTIRTQGHSALSGPEVTLGEGCLRTAAAAIDAMDQRVKVESEVVWGPPSNALVQQSRSAALVCVGSTGIGAVARAALGSTATAVAGLARCSVAVIRPRDRGDVADFVAVGVDARPEVDGLIERALDEARLRRSPLVVAALGCNVFGVNSVERTAIRVDTWKRRYPDVTVEVMAAQSSLSDFLADHHDDLRERHGSGDDTDAWARPLAVLDAADVHDVARIVGPHDHSILRHAYCSVLVAR
jgi:nucleotide-binding universal stress UspA family protein